MNKASLKHFQPAGWLLLFARRTARMGDIPTGDSSSTPPRFSHSKRREQPGNPGAGAGRHQNRPKMLSRVPVTSPHRMLTLANH